MLDGSFDLKGYSNTQAISVDYYKEGMKYGEYTLGNLKVEFEQDGSGTLKSVTRDGAEIKEIDDPDGNPIQIENVSISYDEVTLSGKNGFEIRFTVDKAEVDRAAQPGTLTDVKLDLTGIGSMTLQIGANENQTLELRMPPITKKNLGLSHTDVLTADNAGKAIDEIANAISFVSNIRSSLGAYQNRLEHTTTNLDVTSENMTSAYSRIMDVDMATEMTKYSSY